MDANVNVKVDAKIRYPTSALGYCLVRSNSPLVRISNVRLKISKRKKVKLVLTKISDLFILSIVFGYIANRNNINNKLTYFMLTVDLSNRKANI